MTGLLLALGILSAACSGDAETGSVLSEDLGPFSTAEIVVGDGTWLVAVADSPAERSQGLRGVIDLGDLDGMLFVFDTTTSTAFTMRGTLMPIDIAFFDAAGSLVDRLAMVPCTAEPCPSYRAGGQFRYALETEAGGFEGIRELALDL